jgi:hypothetical protein
MHISLLFFFWACFPVTSPSPPALAVLEAKRIIISSRDADVARLALLVHKDPSIVQTGELLHLCVLSDNVAALQGLLGFLSA